ncbi:DUF4845 domain-containing protein [Sinimarinibacterium sp. NLF-5-8]|uniref:DUF4845 domain-containing protein n=1 Tax=Sinimarinibacterium sp. NLF-5-8 TaxID=2698684 RepID=UPI00137C1022|nr:DUF4845 domain-containing protein [Sinimarinibacterium sp. NLF-5-8]QHS09828.1 DUF4845 domain-containing protein [Sinimarinibacterium sp. NLF-5-8]
MRQSQRGLSLLGLVFVLGIIAFFAVITVKCVPIYLNHMKVASSVAKVAADPESARAEAATIRTMLQRFWDIESIDYLQPRDVKIKRTPEGRYLSYDYEAYEHLFYNIAVVIHFQDDVPLSGQ